MSVGNIFDGYYTDPYGAGWMFKIKPANAADATSLLSADAYRALIG